MRGNRRIFLVLIKSHQLGCQSIICSTVSRHNSQVPFKEDYLLNFSIRVTETVNIKRLRGS